jgi:2-dehydro-3-deoxyglucarate aldolase/4-hydroxy-2-oxoheptanedioate aldolase
MDSYLSRVKEKMSRKELVIGSHVATSDAVVSEIISAAGYDFLWIDWEHGALDRKDVNLHIMAVRSQGVAPFVRVPWNDPALVKPILDMGPAAVVFPFVKTAEEARRAVASCKYPPKGIRGFAPVRAIGYGTTDTDAYLEMAASEPWVIIQIEHVDALPHVEEIISVPGVDTIVIGANDLSGSMGLLTQVRHPKVMDACDKVAEICNRAHFPFGTSLLFSEENVRDWIKRGVSWIGVDNDVSYLIKGARATFEATKILADEFRGKGRPKG